MNNIGANLTETISHGEKTTPCSTETLQQAEDKYT